MAGTAAHWRPHQRFREKKWLIENYVVQKRSAAEIASDFDVTDAAVLFWIRRHKIPRRTMSESRIVKHWGLSGADNPMWNRRGELNHNWRGGVSPERQAFYLSRDWKQACSAVWKRDDATCQRCRMHKDDSADVPFHIHHIESFANEKKRAIIQNLVLLCEICHRFVHSRKNVGKDFLKNTGRYKTVERRSRVR